MIKGKLYYTIGNPRSGKSSYAQKWVLEKSERPRVIISGDCFRKAIHGLEFLPEAETIVFSSMDVATRALLISGFDVLIDETSTTKETLKRYYRIDINAKPIAVLTPEETCIERAIKTNKEYLIQPIQRINQQLNYLIDNLDSVINEIKHELLARKSSDITV